MTNIRHEIAIHNREKVVFFQSNKRCVKKSCHCKRKMTKTNKKIEYWALRMRWHRIWESEIKRVALALFCHSFSISKWKKKRDGKRWKENRTEWHENYHPPRRIKKKTTKIQYCRHIIRKGICKCSHKKWLDAITTLQ